MTIQHAARRAVQDAIRRGTLVKATERRCADCGRQAEEYHHADYTRPLAVTPLCTRCHGVRHRAFYVEFAAIKPKLTKEARNALDALAASRKRKGELVNDLLLAAAARYEAIEAGTAPLDDFTQALLRAKYIREQREG